MKKKYYLKNIILKNVINKNYSIAKEQILKLSKNKKEKGLYNYILEAINYLENPYQLSNKQNYNYQITDNLYKHFFEALRCKDYIEAYLTIKNEDLSEDFNKRIIKILLKQIYDINNVKENEIPKEEKKLQKKEIKLNNLAKYTKDEDFTRALRYLKNHKKLFSKDELLIYKVMLMYGNNCLKYEYLILKDEIINLYQNNQLKELKNELNELEKLLKKLDIKVNLDYAYETILEKEKLSINSYQNYVLAKEAYAIHNYSLSLSLINECLKEPYSKYYFFKGKILEKLNRKEEAKEAYNDALKLCESPYTLIRLGLLEYQSKFYKEALNDLKKASERVVDKNDIYDKIAKIYNELVQNNNSNKYLKLIKK